MGYLLFCIWKLGAIWCRVWRQDTLCKTACKRRWLRDLNNYKVQGSGLDLRFCGWPLWIHKYVHWIDLVAVRSSMVQHRQFVVKRAQSAHFRACRIRRVVQSDWRRIQRSWQNQEKTKQLLQLLKHLSWISWAILDRVLQICQRNLWYLQRTGEGDQFGEQCQWLAHETGHRKLEESRGREKPWRYLSLRQRPRSQKPGGVWAISSALPKVQKCFEG